MTMTMEEINDFWKLGAVLRSSSAPKSETARWLSLKKKMVEAVGVPQDSHEEEKPMDMSRAISALANVLGAFSTIASMIPQLQAEPETAKLVEEGVAAIKWLKKAKLDSLNNPEK